MKGVSGIVTFVLTIGIIISTITVVWLSGKPVIDKSQESAIIAESSNILNALDNVIKDVVYGKAGSSRVLTLSISGGEYFVRNDDNSIEFSLDTTDAFIEPDANIKNGNLYKAGARDVTAKQKTISGVDSLVLENSNVMFAIRSIPSSAAINTSNLIVLMRNKKLDMNLSPLDSSIVINNLDSTKEGTGYTFFVDNGTRLGYGQVVARVTSGGVSYDIYYTLKSNADFINIEIRNSTTASNVTFVLENSVASGVVSSASKYITHHNSTVATGLYDNGLTLLSISNSGNKLKVEQGYGGNEVLAIMTAGSNTTISNANVDDINEWSGSFGYGVNKRAKYYSWLYYPIINFTKNETFGKGQYKIYIYNNGTTNGKAQIEISTI